MVIIIAINNQRHTQKGKINESLTLNLEETDNTVKQTKHKKRSATNYVPLGALESVEG
jgi:hypothetical protein